MSGQPDAAVRAKLRKILIGVTIGIFVLGALGFMFVRWLATLPPGSLKAH